MAEDAARNALIVGGTGGIGSAIARELCKRGPTSLALVYREDQAAAERSRRELELSARSVRLLRADVGSAAGIEAIAGLIRDSFNERVDVLVYSAGHRTIEHTLALSPEEWQRSLDVTLTGFVRCVQIAADAMPPGGRVLAISGLSGERAFSDVHLAMGVAKAALQHAVRYLALTLAPAGVNVNCLCLGSVLTEGVAADLTVEEYERFVASATARNPKGRIPDALTIAPIAGFLCSEEADWIVGQVIIADGGETLG